MSIFRPRIGNSTLPGPINPNAEIPPEPARAAVQCNGRHQPKPRPTAARALTGHPSARTSRARRCHRSPRRPRLPCRHSTPPHRLAVARQAGLWNPRHALRRSRLRKNLGRPGHSSRPQSWSSPLHQPHPPTLHRPLRLRRQWSRRPHPPPLCPARRRSRPPLLIARSPHRLRPTRLSQPPRHTHARRRSPQNPGPPAHHRLLAQLPMGTRSPPCQRFRPRLRHPRPPGGKASLLYPPRPPSPQARPRTYLDRALRRRPHRIPRRQQSRCAHPARAGAGEIQRRLPRAFAGLPHRQHRRLLMDRTQPRSPRKKS